MFHAAERRHAGPFWARHRRLAKNEPACITGMEGLTSSINHTWKCARDIDNIKIDTVSNFVFTVTSHKLKVYY